jgi:hypothetical protein
MASAAAPAPGSALAIVHPGHRGDRLPPGSSVRLSGGTRSRDQERRPAGRADPRPARQPRREAYRKRNEIIGTITPHE